MRAGKIAGCLLAAGLAAPLVFLGQLLFAQQGPIQPRPTPAPPAPLDDKPRVNLRAETNLVLVPTAVTDNRNRPVGGLAKEDFEVYDDQVRQEIVSFAKEDDPLAFCIVYDVSSSMGGNTKTAWEMAHYVIQHAMPGDELCAVTLASDAKLAMPLTADERSRDIDDKLFWVKGGGTTALLDGVYLALNELKKSKKLRKAMFIVSDGLDNSSRYTEGEVLNAAKESDAMIYARYYKRSGAGRSFDDKQVLLSLTRATGGLFLPNVERVILDLRTRYVLGFSPANVVRDGGYHRLSVKVRAPKGLPKIYVDARRGYFAPVN